VLARVLCDADLQIADVGTGSGAIAIALAKELPGARVLASDISDAAIEIARENSVRLGVADRIDFVRRDLLPDASDKFDVVVSNPPYIADGERDSLAREVKDFEPGSALFSGPTGLEIYRRLVPLAARALKPGGLFVLEIGAAQAPQLREMLHAWRAVEILRDLANIERVVCARRG
jgi:release factor glutamine methyltransferase